MQQVALRLPGAAAWTYLGGDESARKPFDLIVRAFDADIEIATGPTAAAPSDEVLPVPRGQGHRLTGTHFFARSKTACRISYRGL